MNSDRKMIDIRPVDVEFYQAQLKEFLPDEIIDIHTHVWLDRMIKHRDHGLARVAQWPSKVARENSIEELIETYRLLFPDKAVMPLIFSNILDKDSLPELNQYCCQCAAKVRCPALAVIRPDWDAEYAESVIADGRFLGAKVYLTFSPDSIPANEIEIFDFLPHHLLGILNKHGWMVILHVARPGRLKDPTNLAQMIEIEKLYPHVKLVVAHVGRAYCMEDVGNAFEVLRHTNNILFDISANTNAEVFRGLIDAVGPRRILFGSDMPITRMRMRRICEQGRYINLVPKGLYGDVSGDKNMREIEGPDADRLSLFIYEQIAAFKEAAISTGLTKSDITDVFYGNSRRLLDAIKPT